MGPRVVKVPIAKPLTKIGDDRTVGRRKFGSYITSDMKGRGQFLLELVMIVEYQKILVLLFHKVNNYSILYAIPEPLLASFERGHRFIAKTWLFWDNLWELDWTLSIIQVQCTSPYTTKYITTLPYNYNIYI